MDISGLEFFIGGFANPSAAGGRVAAVARRVEEEGYDGWWVADSPALAYDPYVALAIAATATTRIKLAVYVTNPFSRHAIVTASSAAALQAESGGRFVLGIGRGDSALAHLGLAPVAVQAFRRSLRCIQAYLRGEVVPFRPQEGELLGVAPLSSLGYEDVPKGSRVTWLPDTNLKVPVEVAASGPKVLRVAGALADRVLISVGAHAERVQWAIDEARTARSQAGLDPSLLGVSAQVCLNIHPDKAKAIDLCRWKVASASRFSAMQGRPAGPASEEDRHTMERAREMYDMNRHGHHLNSVGSIADNAFVERHAIIGTPDQCIERFCQLVHAGIDRFVIGSGLSPDADELITPQLLAQEVMPAVRAEIAKYPPARFSSASRG